MGDAGALFLGLLLASLIVRLDTNPINMYATFSIPILILATPILDTCVAIASRLRRRISPFQGGRDHLSHRLMRIGFSKRMAVSTLWLMSVYFGALAIAVSYAPYYLEGLVITIASLSWILLFLWFITQRDE
jgi:UDP-GlcNAc:undecaprenyl-phosphate GlcNAc-1-phosphate transferase